MNQLRFGLVITLTAIAATPTQAQTPPEGTAIDHDAQRPGHTQLRGQALPAVSPPESTGSRQFSRRLTALNMTAPAIAASPIFPQRLKAKSSHKSYRVNLKISQVNPSLLPSSVSGPTPIRPLGLLVNNAAPSPIIATAPRLIARFQTPSVLPHITALPLTRSGIAPIVLAEDALIEQFRFRNP